MPQFIEELDDEGICFIYKRRCKEDSLVVPYNLEILLFWGGSMNIQRVSKHGFEMYLTKYISKPESSFDVKLSKNPSDPEKYLRTRVIGACEALDIQLGFNQYHMSRNTVFIDTELQPKQRFLKTHAQLKALDSDSEMQSKFEVYLQRNKKLHDITYPMYFQWWRKCTYSEQCKAKKNEKKDGSTVTLGFKGTDEFIELKQSIEDNKKVVTLFCDALNNLSVEIKGDLDLQIAALSIINNVYQHAGIVKSFTEYLGHEEYHCRDIDSDHAESNARANEILCNAGLLDHNLIDKANKPHWLYGNMIIDHDGIVDNIKSRMLKAYPAGTMLKDISGHFWVRRTRAAITRHRFITVDDQENYYMQKYLLSIPVSPNDDIVSHPPSS